MALASYTPSGMAFDVAVAALPFLSAASDQTPTERALADAQKQQVDQSQVPGDQSLGLWWNRSQSDWSGGSGSEFMEPPNDDLIMRSSWVSYGVDPWTPGKLSLLQLHASQGATCQLATMVYTRGVSPKVASITHDPPMGYVFGATGLGLTEGYRIVPDDDYLGATLTALSGWPGVTSGRPKAVIGGGYCWVVADELGSSYLADASAASTTFAANVTGMGTATKGVWDAKGRIILAVGPDLYAVPYNTGGSSSVALSTLSGDKVSPPTAPDATLTWVGCADTPGAILVGAHSASAGSSIQRFTVSTDGAITTLSALSTVAQLPEGEELYNIQSYLGSYLILLTSLGVRIAVVATDGSVQYGPLSYEGDVGTSIARYSSYFYVSVADAGSSRTGLIRLNLADIDSDGRVPWAYDVRSGATNSSSSAGIYGIWPLTDGKFYLLCDDGSGGNHTLQGPTGNLEASGYAESGWIRMGTLEPKTFNAVRVQCLTPLDGTFSVTLIEADGTETSLGSHAASADTVEFPIDLAPCQRIKLRLTLTRDSVDATTGPTMDGWQLLSLPAPSRQELIRAPLLCFDFERDSHGQEWGYEGAAAARYQALRDAVRDGSPVNFQDLNTGETIRCQVDSLTFQQVAPPSNTSGFGGILTVTVRTL